MEKFDTQQSLARSKVYRLLSVGFLYPDEDFFNLLSQGSFFDELKLWGEFLEEDPEKSFLRKVEEEEEALTEISLEGLKMEYERVFGHTISKECPSYETEYDLQNIFQQTQTLADLAGFYRAFGLEVSPAHGERLDHIGVELEFMGFLAFKEYYAIEKHGEEKAKICRDAQRKFIKEYLGRWAPHFLKLLRKKGKKGIYYSVAAITDMFLASEMKFFKVHPQPVGVPQPQGYEFDDTCVSCVNDLENP